MVFRCKTCGSFKKSHCDINDKKVRSTDECQFDKNKRRQKEQVLEIDIDQTKQYEYYAYNTGEQFVCIASNSLNKLKQEIKKRRWRFAMIGASTGCLSRNGCASEQISYNPKYK